MTLRFRVAGTGNLKWVDRGPEVRLGGAKVYPPQVKTRAAHDRGGRLRLAHVGVRGGAADDRAS